MSNKNRKKYNVFCPYCGRRAELVDSKSIYGRSCGKVHLCRDCMAYVGTHKGSNRPLGRLANAELREWKIAAHKAFDPLWMYGRFKGNRNGAYRWLSEQVGLPVNKTHIGMFDVPECRQAIGIINKRKGELYHGKQPL